MSPHSDEQRVKVTDGMSPSHSGVTSFYLFTGKIKLCLQLFNSYPSVTNVESPIAVALATWRYYSYYTFFLIEKRSMVMLKIVICFLKKNRLFLLIKHGQHHATKMSANCMNSQSLNLKQEDAI